MGRPLNSAADVRPQSHGQADGVSGEDDRSYGAQRADGASLDVTMGDRPWVILGISGRQLSAKAFEMMVARDGIEPPTPAFSGLRSTI